VIARHEFGGAAPERAPRSQNQQMATLFLMVGLPGAGKTVRAKELAARHGALRLSPDAWMIPLFGESEAGGKRDVLEGRLIWLALAALRLGTSVILDFGFWARDERSALRWLTAEAGASCQVVYLPVDRATQRVRITHRQAHAPHQTFAISQAEADRLADPVPGPRYRGTGRNAPTRPAAGLARLGRRPLAIANGRLTRAKAGPAPEPGR
jgi:predicted kinase